MSSLTIAEELLLAAWDDDAGKSALGVDLGSLVAGALVIELTLRDAAEISDERLRVTDAPRTGEPLLDEVRETIRSARRQRKVQEWVQRLASKHEARDRVADRLVERGILRRETRRFLGLVPYTRRPVADRAATEQARRRLSTALLSEEELPPHDAALGGLAAPAGRGLVRRLYDDRDQQRAALRHAKELSEGKGISAEVSKAVRDTQAAAIAAAAAAAAVTASSGSSGSS